jgi:hypothetical protein
MKMTRRSVAVHASRGAVKARGFGKASARLQEREALLRGFLTSRHGHVRYAKSDIIITFVIAAAKARRACRMQDSASPNCLLQLTKT